jgi:hypothetical protein
LAEEEDCFDVFGYLKKLRQSRKGLIETLVWIIPYMYYIMVIEWISLQYVYEALVSLRQTFIAVEAFISTFHQWAGTKDIFPLLLHILKTKEGTVDLSVSSSVAARCENQKGGRQGCVGVMSSASCRRLFKMFFVCVHMHAWERESVCVI